MRKSIALLLAGVLLLQPFLLLSVGAFFLYSDSSVKIENATASTSNALFDDAADDDYYRVYFFASPYYATGAEIDGTSIVDPLKIANQQGNPYNSDEEYLLIGKKLNNSPKYANAKFSSGDYHYISYKKKNVDILSGDYGSLELFSKKDYTGYIRANADMGITQQTSIYVQLTVQGNLSMEQLSGIVAATEFKDHYGFGPEFIGWTYQKEATAKRTMYGTERYTTDSDMKMGDSRGYNIGGTAYQLGNFGCQGEIEQITSTTSLKAIDRSTVDGSQNGDRIIYLYPVFAAKNYHADKTVGGEMTPIIKFRVNADNTTDADGTPCHEYNQSYEIDYSQNRYTVGLFQRKLNAAKNNVNYYIDNLYIGDDVLQLDVCPVGSSAGWVSSWSTVFSQEHLAALGLKKGYYNVDVTFVQVLGTYDASGCRATVDALLEDYRNTQRYVQLASSFDVSETGLVQMVHNHASPAAKSSAYFVIGFQKVEEYRLVGDKLNDAISDYHASGYQTLHTTSQMGDHVQYILNNVELHAGAAISVLTQEANGLTGTALPYQIASMSAEVLAEIQSAVGYAFSGIGSRATDDIQLQDNTIKINHTDRYTLVFSVELRDGKPAAISVAYRRNDHKYSFIVLSAKPTQTFFTDKTALSAQMLVQCESRIGSVLNLNTVLTDVHAKGSTGTDIPNIEALFSYFDGKKMVDTATGVELPRRLFENGNFYLNRNYVVYFE